MNIPRCEHPNPQWERENWRNLNGEWEFDFDFGKSARERKLYLADSLPKKINVPFCPESKLSGIGYTDFISSVCYRKSFDLSADELRGKILLHFGAVDFHSFVYINGSLAGEHIGGYSSFDIDITQYAKLGENTVFVIAEDDVRSSAQPTGKQSRKYNSHGCYYTRTTGIWQTVWLEFLPEAHVVECRYYPDIHNGSIVISGNTCGAGELALAARYEGKEVGAKKLFVNGFFSVEMKLSELHLWEIGCGRLYDLEIRFVDDVVKSYFGMREVRLDGMKFKLNGKTLFLRTVLDQGFYPDGIYTAPDDEALKRDVELSMAVGFHGARLHQKVFEKRFLYHCDRAGYIVWGEHGNWDIDYSDAAAQGNFICEWSEIIKRDFNSPALIGWCPFNETWGYKEREADSRLIESVYRMTKLYDMTRPCIDTSGNYHIDKREIYDVHDYRQVPEAFAENYGRIGEGIVCDQIERRERGAQPYFGEPIFLSEYGGIQWAPDAVGGWGYGDAPKTVDEYTERFCGLAEAISSNPYIMGMCYTQLYDVEQERNGIYNYDRSAKFGAEVMAKMKASIEKTAAIEKE